MRPGNATVVQSREWTQMALVLLAILVAPLPIMLAMATKGLLAAGGPSRA